MSKKMEKKILLYILIVLATVIVLVLWLYREQSLSRLITGEGIPEYDLKGSQFEVESSIEGSVSQEIIEDLLNSTIVRKGRKNSIMPSPCFEISVIYSNETYRVVVGADKTISVAPLSNLDSRTFWFDTKGDLFEQLYNIHLGNGGEEFVGYENFKTVKHKI